jgi:hypothetical protein
LLANPHHSCSKTLSVLEVAGLTLSVVFNSALHSLISSGPTPLLGNALYFAFQVWTGKVFAAVAARKAPVSQVIFELKKKEQEYCKIQ